MSGLFSSPKMPVPITSSPPPSRSAADVQASALAVRQRRASATGRADTILAKGADEENLTAKRLLGTA